MTVWTAQFWRDTAERAMKTAVQALIALFGVGMTVLDLDWPKALAGVGTMVLLSVLTSLASTLRGDPYTASALPVSPPGRHEA